MLSNIQQLQGLKLNLNNELSLRVLETSDALDILTFRGNPEVMRYIDDDVLETVEQAVNWINSYHSAGDSIRWGILFNGKLIGTIGLYHINFKHSFAFIGFELHADYMEKSIMTIVLLSTTNYLLWEGLLHRIEAQCHVDNVASIKVLEKAGFTLEAKQKGNYFFEGKFEDSFLYSKVAN